MRVFFILLGKELRSFFFSPIAYIVLAMFMALSGFTFAEAVDKMRVSPHQNNLVQATFNPGWLYFYFFLIFPIITMRLFAEEQKLGTLESLLTAPVRTVHVLLAKYCAAVIFYLVLWLPNLLYLGVVSYLSKGKVDIPEGSLLGSYLIILLTGLFHLGIGCLTSALTRNQIVAAIVCLSASLLHFLIGYVSLYVDSKRGGDLQNLVNYFATPAHFDYFCMGLIDSRAIVYYVSFTVLLLTLTHQVLEYRRWKS